MSGRRKKRTRRSDATTSWCNERTRGWRNERTARGNATTSLRNKMTRGRHNESMIRGYATTSWHDEVTRGRCGERRHNLIVFRVQMESNGKVVAMVVAHIERKPDFFFI